MKHSLQQTKLNRVLFYLFLGTNLILFSSCSAQKKKETTSAKISVLEDSIIKPYTYFNELKVSLSNGTLQKHIQALSENTNLVSTVPEERLKEKITLFKLCLQTDISDCNYTPEAYKILSNKKTILNIEYSYNGFGNPDQYNKYASFDLIKEERLTHQQIFTDASSVINTYNTKYVANFEEYLNDLDTENEDDLDEYDAIKEHLKTRTPFRLNDLNNFELVYVDDAIESIRFHYNGQGGLYKNVFPSGYEEFSLEDLKPYLSDSFKKQISLK